MDCIVLSFDYDWRIVIIAYWFVCSHFVVTTALDWNDDGNLVCGPWLWRTIRRLTRKNIQYSRVRKRHTHATPHLPHRIFYLCRHCLRGCHRLVFIAVELEKTRLITF